MGLLLRAGALAGVAAALAGCAASSKTAAKDVKITACTPTPNGGHPKASGQIVNHSSKASVYTIHVKFKDSAGNGVGDGFTAVRRPAGTPAVPSARRDRSSARWPP